MSFRSTVDRMPISPRIRSAVALTAIAAATLVFAQSPPAVQDARDMGEAIASSLRRGAARGEDLLDRKQYREGNRQARRPDRPAPARTAGALPERCRADRPGQDRCSDRRCSAASLPIIPNCRSRTTISRSFMRRRANTHRRVTSSSAPCATAPDWAVAHENLGDIYARLAAVEYRESGEAGQAQQDRGREAEADPRNAGQQGLFTHARRTCTALAAPRFEPSTSTELE